VRNLPPARRERQPANLHDPAPGRAATDRATLDAMGPATISGRLEILEPGEGIDDPAAAARLIGQETRTALGGRCERVYLEA
jgi:hypothetical protein